MSSAYSGNLRIRLAIVIFPRFCQIYSSYISLVKAISKDKIGTKYINIIVADNLIAKP